MDIRKLQRAIVDGLEDVKAQNIVVFNTEHLSPLFERVIVASGASNRQTKALAASIRDAVRTAGMDVLRTEGEENGEWIIVDCGAAVAHVMQPSIRDYYRLEEIWGGKPVAIKLNTKSGGLVKASEGFDEDEERGRGAQAEEAARPRRQGRRRRRDAGQEGRAEDVGREEGRRRKSCPAIGKDAANQAEKAIRAAKAVHGREDAGGQEADGPPGRGHEAGRLAEGRRQAGPEDGRRQGVGRRQDACRLHRRARRQGSGEDGRHQGGGGQEGRRAGQQLAQRRHGRQEDGRQEEAAVKKAVGDKKVAARRG